TAWQLITHESSSPTYGRLSKPIPKAHQSRYGSFRATDEVQAAWRATKEIALALRAPAVLFQTPASFTPSSAHRTQVRPLFSELERDGLRLVWEPKGLWEPATVRTLCRELDLIHCTDPVLQKTTTEQFAYYRLHGLSGHRGAISDADLAKALGACDGFEEA